MKLLATAIIKGRPRVLKNNKRIFGRGGRKVVLPSVQYLNWEKEALAGLLAHKSIALIDTPVVATYRFYFENRHAEPDVSNLIEGPQDVLVKAGILKNDKLIMRVEAEKFFGHAPRTEVALYAYQAEVSARKQR